MSLYLPSAPASSPTKIKHKTKSRYESRSVSQCVPQHTLLSTLLVHCSELLVWVAASATSSVLGPYLDSSQTPCSVCHQILQLRTCRTGSFRTPAVHRWGTYRVVQLKPWILSPVAELINLLALPSLCHWDPFSGFAQKRAGGHSPVLMTSGQTLWPDAQRCAGVLVWRDISLTPTPPHPKAEPTTRAGSIAAQVRCRPVLSRAIAGERWGQLCSALGHQHGLRWQPRLGMSECPLVVPWYMEIGTDPCRRMAMGSDMVLRSRTGQDFAGLRWQLTSGCFSAPSRLQLLHCQ